MTNHKATKNSSKIRGITFGAFDFLHAGHVLMLKESKEQCDYLIVGLHTDPSKERPKKNKPIETVEERLIRLYGCKYVDAVVLYDTEADLVELLKELDIHVRFVGVDYKGKNFTGKDLKIKVVYNTRNHNYSSSNLRKRICQK